MFLKTTMTLVVLTLMACSPSPRVVDPSQYINVTRAGFKEGESCFDGEIQPLQRQNLLDSGISIRDGARITSDISPNGCITWSRSTTEDGSMSRTGLSVLWWEEGPRRSRPVQMGHASNENLLQKWFSQRVPTIKNEVGIVKFYDAQWGHVEGKVFRTSSGKFVGYAIPERRLISGTKVMLIARDGISEQRINDVLVHRLTKVFSPKRAQ